MREQIVVPRFWGDGVPTQEHASPQKVVQHFSEPYAQVRAAFAMGTRRL